MLILGAGTTRAARPNAPISRLPPLDADFFEIATRCEASSAKAVSACLGAVFGEYSGALLNSLETATSCLYLKALDAKPKDDVHQGFLLLLALLRRVLGFTTNVIKPGKRSLVYRFLRSELKKAGGHENLSIITFNYDLLIERCLAELSKVKGGALFHFPGCYRLSHIERSHLLLAEKPPEPFDGPSLLHEGVPIYKLHGSLNWYSAHKSQSPTPRQLFKDTRQIYVVRSPVISTKKGLSYKRTRRRLYMHPVIVPPVSGKRIMMHREIAAIWGQAAKALQSAERIVIVGYSCPPLDLESRILLSENLRKNPNKKNVYVVDPNSKEAAKFSTICGVDHMTIYDSLNDWIRDAKP